MSIPLYQVDAFADRPFVGNPAAVCLLPGPASEAWMQDVAYQASQRGGTIRVRVAGDRVHLGGRAVMVLRGELLRASGACAAAPPR